MLKNLEDPTFESHPNTMPKMRRFVLPLDVAEAPLDQNLGTWHMAAGYG